MRLCVKVSLSYFSSIYRAKGISCRKKLALYYWLPWRLRAHADPNLNPLPLTLTFIL